MARPYSLFSYKSGSSFLHRCPAWCKLLIVPALNILFLVLPPACTVFFIAIQAILATCLHFTLQEQLCDVKPILYYAGLILLFQLITAAASGFPPELFAWEAEKETVFLLLKLFAIMQSASLLFKTSTSLELRHGIAAVFGPRSSLTNALSLFLTFLPLVSRLWEQSKRAWFARGGRQSVRMYAVLLPVLFSVGMKKAWNTARATAIRM